MSYNKSKANSVPTRGNQTHPNNLLISSVIGGHPNVVDLISNWKTSMLLYCLGQRGCDIDVDSIFQFTDIA